MAERNKPLPSLRIKDIRGQRFGKLRVVEFSHIDNSNSARWHCLCDCGNECSVTTGELTRKQRHVRPRSCGCSQRESASETFTKHGMTDTPEYNAWHDMRLRCSNPNVREWQRYGARGITVCQEWDQGFDAFLRDMGPRPGPGYSLERKDVHGNYEPGNCEWVKDHRQQWNRRDTVKTTYQGREMSLGELAKITGISRYALRGRIVKNGMTGDEAAAWDKSMLR